MCLLHMHQYKQALTYYEKALELIEQEKLKGEGGSIRKQAAESLTNTINRDIKFCNSLIAKEKT